MEQSLNTTTRPMSRLKKAAAFVFDRHFISDRIDVGRTEAQALPTQLVLEGLGAISAEAFLKTEMDESTRDLL